MEIVVISIKHAGMIVYQTLLPLLSNQKETARRERAASNWFAVPKIDQIVATVLLKARINIKTTANPELNI